MTKCLGSVVNELSPIKRVSKLGRCAKRSEESELILFPSKRRSVSIGRLWKDPKSIVDMKLSDRTSRSTASKPEKDSFLSAWSPFLERSTNSIFSNPTKGALSKFCRKFPANRSFRRLKVLLPNQENRFNERN